jgi:hypothetical protein
LKAEFGIDGKFSAAAWAERLQRLAAVQAEARRRRIVGLAAGTVHTGDDNMRRYNGQSKNARFGN